MELSSVKLDFAHDVLPLGASFSINFAREHAGASRCPIERQEGAALRPVDMLRQNFIRLRHRGERFKDTHFLEAADVVHFLG